MLNLLFCLLLPAAQAAQGQPPAKPQPTQAPPATAQPQPQPTQPRPAAPPAQPRRPAAITIEIRVTNRSGTPLEGVHITADGPSLREATTDSSGMATLRSVTGGNYRIRAEHDGFVTLEKEVATKNTGPTTTEFSLSAAAPPAPPPPPAPEPPPPPPPPVVAPQGAPGDPSVVSVPDVAEKSLRGRDAVKRLSIGCSGVSDAQLVQVRETLPTTTHPDADEMLYVVAGDASLKLGDKEHAITSGWFTVVPRSTPYSLTRKGRNPVILLSIITGQPCRPMAASAR